MNNIIRVPLSIRLAHLPEVGANAQYYRDLADTLEQIRQHILVIEGFLTVIAKTVGMSRSEIEAAIREIAAQADTGENEIDALLSDMQELVRALAAA